MFIHEVHEIAGTALMSVPQLQGGAAPMAGGGVIDWINVFTQDVKGAISGILIVAGLVVGGLIAASKRTVVGAILGVVVGGFIAGIGGLILAFGSMAQKEVVAIGQAETAHVLVVDETHAPGGKEA